MKRINVYGQTEYDPKPETFKARAELDKILKDTRFSWRTKGLWSYFRGGTSTDKARRCRKNKGLEVYIVSLSLNGALSARLMTLAKCRYCNMPDCKDRLTRRQQLNRFKKSIRPSTIANWNHAIELIDIFLEHKDGKPARPTGI
jgi:hypothetical protein